MAIGVMTRIEDLNTVSVTRKFGTPGRPKVKVAQKRLNEFFACKDKDLPLS